MRVQDFTAADRSGAWKATLIMEQSPRSHFPISQLAAMVNLPEKKLKAVFKFVYGMGLYAYLRQVRMDRAREMLLEGKPIKVIIHVIGYENESNFCKAFRKVHQESPNKWRKRQLKKTG